MPPGARAGGWGARPVITFMIPVFQEGLNCYRFPSKLMNGVFFNMNFYNNVHS